MVQAGIETEKGKTVDEAIQIIEKLESECDIFTLNRAIATILERRARSAAEWHDWLSEKLPDAERTSPDMRPLMLDLS